MLAWAAAHLDLAMEVEERQAIRCMRYRARENAPAPKEARGGVERGYIRVADVPLLSAIRSLNDHHGLVFLDFFERDPLGRLGKN